MKKFIQLLIFLALSTATLNAQQLIGTTNKIVVINPSTVVFPGESASAAISVVDIVKLPMIDKLGSSSDNYKWEQELDSIIKLKYRKFLDQFVSPHSMAYDALKALKEKEERYGLTKEIKDEYIYWYKAIRDDVKANYNIDLSK